MTHLGPHQLAHCRQWPAFRDLEERVARARADYEATRPKLHGIGLRASLARLDRLAANAAQHTQVRR